jgi:hypothetical protein
VDEHRLYGRGAGGQCSRAARLVHVGDLHGSPNNYGHPKVAVGSAVRPWDRSGAALLTGERLGRTSPGVKSAACAPST